MKKITITITMLLMLQLTKAQISHAVGASVFFVSTANDGKTSAYGVSYLGKYSIGKFSVGLPITLGFSGSVNSRQGASTGSSFTYQLPLVVDYNIGLGSDPEKEDGSFGFYAGLGYGIFGTGSVGVFGSEKLTANGPIARAGVRFMVKERIYTVGGSFLKGGGTAKANVIGLTALLHF